MYFNESHVKLLLVLVFITNMNRDAFSSNDNKDFLLEREYIVNNR